MMRLFAVALCLVVALTLVVAPADAYVAGKAKRTAYAMGPGMCPPTGCPPMAAMPAGAMPMAAMPMGMPGYNGPITKCKPPRVACGPMPMYGPMPCPPPPCGPMPCPPPCETGSTMAWY